MNIDKYNFIIWDWNGTLFNDLGLCVDIMNNILSKRHLACISIETYRSIFDFPVKNYYQKLGFNFEKENFEAVGTEFIDEYNRLRFNAGLHKGAKEILHQISKMDKKQYILSAREHNALLEDLAYFGISNYIEDVSGLNNHFAAGKLQLGKDLIKKHHINTSKCLLIGDTLHDAEVAKKMDVDCVLIAGGHQSKKRLLSGGVPVLDAIGGLYG